MDNYPKDWHLFAWQGLQLTTPGDWNPGVLEGDERSGYCRLDDDEHIRLELRWAVAKSLRPIAETVERYLKSLDKRRDKNAAPPRTRRATGFVAVADAESECFEVHGDAVEEYGLAARSARTRRVALVRVLGHAEKSFRSRARRVLASYRDGPADDLTRWAVYGFAFSVPGDYTLATYTAAAGRLSFSFRARRRSADAVRVGLAEIVLQRHSLLEWLRGDAAGQFKGWQPTFADKSDGERRVVEVAGERGRGLKGFFSRRLILRCRAWHDDGLNAIHVARWTGPAAAVDEFERFARSFSGA